MVDRVIGGNFRLVECIGEGAMGRVYRAEQLSLGRTVAVKLLHPRLQDEEAFRDRFQHEARAASCLNHANSVAVIDFGYADGNEPYIVMEFLRGRSLTDLVAADFPLRPSRIAVLCSQIASALEEAHTFGIVHCDHKPDNILVEALRDGREHVKVLDFGLARLLATQLEAHARRSGSYSSGLPGPADPSLSATLRAQDSEESEVMGTPRYLAPERLRGKPPAPPQDVYALGVILYEMLCGTPPFGGSVSQVVSAHLNEEPIPPAARQPDLRIPSALDELCLTCLIKEPARRLSATQVKLELDRFIVARTPGDRLIPCPECGAPNRADARFCSECGAENAMARARGAAARVAGTPLPRPPLVFDEPELLELEERPFEEEVHTGVTAIPSAFEALGATGALLPLPLVGRDQELDALEGLCSLGVEDARFVLVSGEPGVGKTRLCDAFSERMAGLGYRTVRGAAEAEPVPATLGPIAQIAEALLGRAPNSSEDARLLLAQQGLDERAWTGLRELFDVGEAPLDLERAVRLRELRAAVKVLVQGATGGSPILLLCEDVDRWDKLSVSLLSDVAASPRVARPLACVITSRTRDLGGFPQRTPRLPVPLLAPQVTRALAIAEAARRGLREGEMLAALGPAAQGLPLHIEQLGWVLVEGMGAAGLQGATLPDLVTSRLSDVPPAARRVLQLVAIAGGELGHEALRACLDADAIRGGVAYLVEHGWLEDQTSDVPAERAVRITHRLLQEVAYSTVPRGSLEEAHGKLADALAGQRARPDVVAHHRDLSGAARGAVEGLLAAGDEAERRLDDHGATMWFRRAHDAARRAMLRMEGEDDEARFGAVSLKLGQALRFTGELQVAQAVVDEATAVEADLVTRIGLLRVLAAIASGRGTNTKARAELERGLELISRGARAGGRAGMRSRPSAALVSELFTELAATYVAEARTEDAIAALERGRDLAAQLDGSGRAPWRLLARLGELYAYVGDRARALTAFVDALDSAREAGSDVGRARVGTVMASFLQATGDDQGARAAREGASLALAAIGDRAALEVLQRQD